MKRIKRRQRIKHIELSTHLDIIGGIELTERTWGTWGTWGTATTATVTTEPITTVII